MYLMHKLLHFINSSLACVFELLHPFILPFNCLIKKFLSFPNIYALKFLQVSLVNKNLSPFFDKPPTIQEILGIDFSILIDDEKLVALESLIIVKSLDLKIICCLYFKPINLLKTLYKKVFLILKCFVLSQKSILNQLIKNQN